ncbi:unnamed protein product [Adineta ricciae]|uniref:Ubiquitin-like domain-containing protein n=1 Tax=Adineta ricciae TaxID=249248 RepID=A0A815X3J8_ADIRI|nr:unnamed protein product [Adineta ricciae]CAF1549093.1 unnamed protein product [Adineta ricciae]
MKVILKTLDGYQVAFEAQCSDKIEQLKTKIKNTLGLEPDQQRLIFAGRKLDSTKLLSDYNITDGSIVHIIYRIPCRMVSES